MVFNARKSGSPYYDARVDDQDQYDDSGAKGWKSDRLGALSLVAAILHATLHLSVYTVYTVQCTVYTLIAESAYPCVHLDNRKMWYSNVQSACICARI